VELVVRSAVDGYAVLPEFEYLDSRQSCTLLGFEDGDGPWRAHRWECGALGTLLQQLVE